jgi:hypothetical protein
LSRSVIAGALLPGTHQNAAGGSKTPAAYQLGKFMKHTVPDPEYMVQSVFASDSTRKYADYVVQSSLSGSVEFDDRNRRNIIWAAGEEMGFLYKDGALQQPQDAVKVVLSSETGKIHAFPQDTTTFSATSCANCGGPVVH